MSNSWNDQCFPPFGQTSPVIIQTRAHPIASALFFRAKPGNIFVQFIIYNRGAISSSSHISRSDSLSPPVKMFGLSYNQLKYLAPNANQRSLVILRRTVPVTCKLYIAMFAKTLSLTFHCEDRS